MCIGLNCVILHTQDKYAFAVFLSVFVSLCVSVTERDCVYEITHPISLYKNGVKHVWLCLLGDTIFRVLEEKVGPRETFLALRYSLVGLVTINYNCPCFPKRLKTRPHRARLFYCIMIKYRSSNFHNQILLGMDIGLNTNVLHSRFVWGGGGGGGGGDSLFTILKTTYTHVAVG